MSVAQTQAANKSLRAEDDQDQYLSFMLADEEYGVDILRVQEIKGWDNVTPLPNTPDYILGVINLRGTVVPIINLRTHFDLPLIAYDKTTVVIVVCVRDQDDGERIMGIAVDAVSEVHNVEKNGRNPSPEFGGSCRPEFIQGLATVGEKMLILLDIDRLMNEGVMQE